MRLMSESTAGSQSSCSSSAWRRASPSSFWRGSISAGNHGAEIGEGALTRGRGVGRAFALGGYRERRERDLELRVVGLDGRDLLHQKARPQKDAQRSALGMASEQPLQLERHGGDERQ